MTYITFDLEWNQPPRGMRPLPEFGEEIIQIGAVKVDAATGHADRFRADVRPKYYTQIKQEVFQLTGISASQLENGMSFPEAAQKLREWCGEEFRFVTWSHEDVPVLRRNLRQFGLDESWVPEVSYDLQKIFSVQKLGKYQQMSLAKAMDLENLPHPLSDHDAMHDALHTACLCETVDFAKGVADYAFYETEAARGQAIAVNKGQGYKTPEDVHADEALRKFVCPECGQPLQVGEWQKMPGIKRKAEAECPQHGVFEVRLRCQPVRSGGFKARAGLYRPEEKTETEQTAE